MKIYKLYYFKRRGGMRMYKLIYVGWAGDKHQIIFDDLNEATKAYSKIGNNRFIKHSVLLNTKTHNYV